MPHPQWWQTALFWAVVAVPDLLLAVADQQKGDDWMTATEGSPRANHALGHSSLRGFVLYLLPI